MKQRLESIDFWLGNEASLKIVVDAQAEMRGRVMEDEVELPAIMTIDNGVAVIDVKGSLTSVNSMWNQYFGITSYDDIRNAIVLAVQDEEVNKILLDIDSPGGHAKGVDELASFITKANKHKPIESYISGSAFSAAYWIAAATSKITGPKMSEAGSIGVIAVIQTYEKMLEERGISTHVFRGGKYKALGGPYEELSEEASEIIQGKIDTMYGFFLDHVSEARNLPRSTVQAKVGEGLTFFAGEALTAGLIDEIASFDEVFTRLVRSSNTTQHITLEDNEMAKKTLQHTEASLAAKAGGASETDVEALMKVLPAKAEGEESSEGEGEETPAAEGEETPESSEEETPAKADDEGIVAFLKETNQELSTNNAKLEAKAEQQTEKITALTADVIALKEIAGTAMSQMAVALGQAAPGDTKNMDTSVVLSQYTAIKVKFTETFHIGGTAEVKDDNPESATAEGEMSHLEAASRDANKI